MNVSSWSIRNPVFGIVLFILLFFAGIFSFRAMKVQQFPDLDFPLISVVATQQGASPNQLESQVGRLIENTVATQAGVKHVYTTIQSGVVMVMVEFNLSKEPDKALDEVRSAITQIQGQLPAGMLPPQVQKMDIASQSLLKYFIRSSAMDPSDLSWFIDNTVAKKLLAVPGVGAVTRIGGVDRQIQVNLNPIKMQALGISAADVAQQLNLTSLDASGGQINLPQSIEPIRMVAAATQASQLAKIQVMLPNGATVPLSSVASIVDTHASSSGAAFEDGKPVVGFKVDRSKGADEISVGKGVMKTLNELQKQYPGVQFQLTVNNINPVQEDYHSSMKLLYEGAILAVVVVWLFLKDWRATFISALALPLSVLPAFVGMHYLGFSINLVTLLALSLVVGILVDDAIVEVENIVRHLRMGKTPYQAAMEAADEIGMAVVATTATLVAVFLPTAFMGGVPGRFFKQFGWTAALAVAASLLVARVLTPMLAAYFLRPIVVQEKESRWLSWYVRKAQWCARYRLATTLFAGAFFIGSLLLIRFLPSGFMPPDNGANTQVNLQLPPGSTIAQTERAVEDARQLVVKNTAIKSIFVTVGNGSGSDNGGTRPGGSSVTNATMDINLVKRDQRPSKQVVENSIRQALSALPGVQFTVGLGNTPGESYQMVLSSDDSTLLQKTALQIQSEIRTLVNIGTVSSDASLVTPEVLITPRLKEAADLGVSPSAIANTVRIATSGDYDFQLPKINLPERQIPIVVQLDPKYRMDLDTLRQMRVNGNKGVVMLGQVADVVYSDGVTAINRYDREQNITINVELNGQNLGEVVSAINQLPAIKQMPTGVHLGVSGDAENMQDLFQSFGLAMLTGVLCIYLVLLLLFKNALHPIAILAALPLSLGGAFVGLLLADKSFSMPSLIGLVMLMGIATKNSILLVEYAIAARRRGMARMEALMDACHKRARPIIMTTIAMAAGMVPAAFGWGQGDNSFRSPMAIAVLGGLITSTILSLVVIPPFFTYIDDLSLWLKKWFQSLLGFGK